MTEMQIGDQTIRYDRDATAAVYGTKEHGFAEGCGCIFCLALFVRIDAELFKQRPERSWHSNACPLRTDVTSMAGGSIS